MYTFTETLFKFWRKREYIFGNVSVYNMFEHSYTLSVEVTIYMQAMISRLPT